MSAVNKKLQKWNWRPNFLARLLCLASLEFHLSLSLGVTWLEKSHENAVKGVNKACGRDEFLNGYTCQYLVFSSSLE